MVTLPPEPPLPAEALAPHRHRAMAESFGADAERYDRTRPHYPKVLADKLLAAIPGRSILDVGIGTGLSARPFRDAGCTVLGVEVDPRMAEVARRRGFDVEVGPFEQWDPGTRTFDAVIAGQTWHWIDPVAGAGQAARALVPGGRLAAFWNVGDPDPVVARAFAEVYQSVDTGLPFTPWQAPALAGYAAILAPVADGIRRTAGFGEPEEWRFGWDTTISRDEWLDQVPTAGGYNQIPPAARAQLLSGLGAVVDAAGGRFTMHYTTVTVTAVRDGNG